MLIRYLSTLVFLVALGNSLTAQTCSDPIVIENIIAQSSTCSNTTGSIIVILEGGETGVDFKWTPDLGNTSAPVNLAPGLYKLRMTRTAEPLCFLDTAIIVSTNGGASPVSNITPANCLLTNGAIELLPSTDMYVWETGLISNKITSLKSGAHYVTVTQTQTSCVSVFKYVVPNVNPLQVSINIIENAKCDLNTAIVQATVTGGTGSYTYNLGNSSLLTGLGPGPQTLIVNDVASGCMDTVDYDIPLVTISATYDLQVTSVSCAGRKDGRVEIINFNPGANFEPPYQFRVVKDGVEVDPNKLEVGEHIMYVADNDSCSLPTTKTFFVTNPPLIMVAPIVLPDTCNSGGQIFLNGSGGTGALQADWFDIPGSTNPLNRTDLPPGKYTGIVYDAASCVLLLDTFEVMSACNRKQYIHQVVKVNTSMSPFCIAPPPGVDASVPTYGLLGGGNNGSSPFGSWNLPPVSGGCLKYSSGNTPGFAVDTVCIWRNVPALGIKDTICFVVSITNANPSKKTIQFSLPETSEKLACGPVPTNFTNYVVAQLNRPGLEGTSGPYGSYVIYPNDGCIKFFSNTNVGSFVDNITVMLYDTPTKQAQIFDYVPSILAQVNCEEVLSLPASWALVTQDCEAPTPICIAVPFSEIGNFSITDNGALYGNSVNGCEEAIRTVYTISDLPNDGPYLLQSWTVNAQTYLGSFTDRADLVSFLNIRDPNGWALRNNNNQIVGGISSNAYGNLVIKSQTATKTYLPEQKNVFSSTELRFLVGAHTVTMTDIKTGCADTFSVNVECKVCPPLHAYPVDNDDNVSLVSYFCDSNPGIDTIFCTNIPNASLGQYVVTRNGQSFNNFFECAGNVGFRVGTGDHDFVVTDNSNSCVYDFRVTLSCEKPLLAQSENIQVAAGGGRDSVCLDISQLEGPLSGIYNVCGSSAPYFTWSLSPENCVQITGAAPGVDSICLQMCSNTGSCILAVVYVTVTGGQPTDSLRAVEDFAAGIRDKPLSIPIIANDIINGIEGNLAGLSNVVVGAPARGSATYDAGSGILEYMPSDGKCGVDSFPYTIYNALGQSSTTKVFVNISCTDILFFNGISPNGDGLNDDLQILGIEGYPNNVLKIFNRWGNLLYETKGYRNDRPWDGTWNGQDLPDGTYFYYLDFGDGKQTLKGFIELLR
jgi:gliding motility-associated-like protein